jgi:hypothetical protein
MINLEENYKQEKLTIDIVKANVYGILILIPIAFIYGVPYFLIWGNAISTSGLKEMFMGSPWKVSVGGLVIFASFTVGIVLHELIHGIVWARYAGNGFKSIRFGVLWKMITPYCHCKEPLKVKHYMLGAIMPAIVLGFLPALVAIVIGNLALLIFAVFFTMAAIGDFMIINLIRKEGMNCLVLDHPSEAGCYIYREIEKE